MQDAPIKNNALENLIISVSVTDFITKFTAFWRDAPWGHYVTRSSAIAEGPRDAIVSTNHADTRRRHIPRLTWRRAVKIDHIALPTKYNYQATSVGR